LAPDLFILLTGATDVAVGALRGAYSSSPSLAEYFHLNSLHWHSSEIPISAGQLLREGRREEGVDDGLEEHRELHGTRHDGDAERSNTPTHRHRASSTFDDLDRTGAKGKAQQRTDGEGHVGGTDSEWGFGSYVHLTAVGDGKPEGGSNVPTVDPKLFVRYARAVDALTRRELEENCEACHGAGCGNSHSDGKTSDEVSKAEAAAQRDRQTGAHIVSIILGQSRPAVTARCRSFRDSTWAQLRRSLHMCPRDSLLDCHPGYPVIRPIPTRTRAPDTAPELTWADGTCNLFLAASGLYLVSRANVELESDVEAAMEEEVFADAANQATTSDAEIVREAAKQGYAEGLAEARAYAERPDGRSRPRTTPHEQGVESAAYADLLQRWSRTQQPDVVAGTYFTNANTWRIPHRSVVASTDDAGSIMLAHAGNPQWFLRVTLGGADRRRTATTWVAIINELHEAHWLDYRDRVNDEEFDAHTVHDCPSACSCGPRRLYIAEEACLRDFSLFNSIRTLALASIGVSDPGHLLLASVHDRRLLRVRTTMLQNFYAMRSATDRLPYMLYLTRVDPCLINRPPITLGDYGLETAREAAREVEAYRDLVMSTARSLNAIVCRYEYPLVSVSAFGAIISAALAGGHGYIIPLLVMAFGVYVFLAPWISTRSLATRAQKRVVTPFNILGNVRKARSSLRAVVLAARAITIPMARLSTLLSGELPEKSRQAGTFLFAVGCILMVMDTSHLVIALVVHLATKELVFRRNTSFIVRFVRSLPVSELHGKGCMPPDEPQVCET
jgi:hypothetical protein